MNYVTILVNAHRPAQDAADQTGLPQTVFYHADWAYSHTESTAKMLRTNGFKSFITWLPTRYFD